MGEPLLDFYSNGILELSPGRQKNFLQNQIKGLSHRVEDPLLIFEGMLHASVQYSDLE